MNFIEFHWVSDIYITKCLLYCMHFALELPKLHNYIDFWLAIVECKELWCGPYTIPRAPQHLNIGYVHKQYQQAYNLDFESIFFLEVNNNDALISLSLPSYRNRWNSRWKIRSTRNYLSYVGHNFLKIPLLKTHF